MKLTITCVHQGYELYGSDRSFVDCVATLRARYPQAEITVVLPRTGPIVEALAPHATAIVVEPLWVLRRRDLKRLATIGLLHLPAALLRAAARFRASDLVYINTSVVADYTIVARLFPGRALLHVHEIPEGPVRTVLRALLGWSRAELIFNSNATRAAFGPMPGGVATHLLYNGITGPAAAEPKTYDGTRPLRLLMLGRLSRIKGQEVLLAALRQLPPEIRSRIALRIVGSAFADDERATALEALIRDGGLTGTVTLSPFVPDPADLYRWADIVVVPSRLPESLGRVAIEAMAYGRPPLVSAIGGLREVVDDDTTGWLVPPDDAKALAERLGAIVTDPAAWGSFPAAARRRYEALFSQDVVALAFGAITARMLASRPRRPPALAGRLRGDEA